VIFHFLVQFARSAAEADSTRAIRDAGMLQRRLLTSLEEVHDAGLPD
jgi:hypothetical protein